MFTPHNILVTGGAGFIGCCYVRHVLNADSDVRIVNLDALTYAGSTDNFKDIKDDTRYTFVQGDITDGALISKLLRDHSIDTLVHFAAESHVDRSISGPGAFVMTNVVGTYELLEASRLYVAENALDQNSFRFHHISTDEVFGALSNTDSAFCETTPYAPNSPYSASKAGSDHLARAYFHTFGLPVTMSNCSNNYGPYQHDEKLIPTVIRKALAGERIPIYGDGSNIRDWLYVYDHCNAIDLIVRKGQLGESYNVGGDAEHANIDLAKAICAKLDALVPKANSYADQLEFVEDRAGHDWRYAINHDKLTAELGWGVSSTLDVGLTQTIAFYIQKYQ